jgi:hypothetical protein
LSCRLRDKGFLRSLDPKMHVAVFPVSLNTMVAVFVAGPFRWEVVFLMLDFFDIRFTLSNSLSI